MERVGKLGSSLQRGSKSDTETPNNHVGGFGQYKCNHKRHYGICHSNKCAALHQRNIEGALQDPTWQPDNILLVAAKHPEQEDVMQILKELWFVIVQEVYSAEKLTSYLLRVKETYNKQCRISASVKLWSSRRTFTVKDWKGFYRKEASRLLLWNNWRAFTVKELQGFYCETSDFYCFTVKDLEDYY